MRKVDLHIHSYASDGEWSPEDVIKNVDENDIKIFAVCDHDTTGCVPFLSELTKNRDDLTFIKGVEVSSTYKGREIHILTYNIDETDTTLQAILKTNIDIREAYNTEIVAYLSKKHNQISVDDYKSYEYNPYQGGWRTYGYFIDRGLITGLSDYWLGIKGFKVDQLFPSPEELIPKLNALGGVTILAHPPAYTEGDLYSEKELDYFRKLGISGIECYTQYTKDQSNSQYYTSYCKRHQLIITGGSDCHGRFVGRKLGFPKVTESMITLLSSEKSKL